MKPGRLILVILLTLLAIIFLKILSPTPINWTPSFSKEEKIPYGNYVLYKTLNDVFTNQQIAVSTVSPYEYLHSDSVKYADNSSTNYIIINRSLEDVDGTSTTALLSFVEEGNTLFLSADALPSVLADTLGLTVHYNYIPTGDTSWVELTNPQFKSVKYPITKSRITINISQFDTARTTILGRFNDSLINFVQMQYGKGTIYIHTSPYLLTNYFAVSPKHRPYIYNTLSYLPVQKTIWDEFYKYGVKQHGSTLGAVLSHPNLQIAYYLVLCGLTLFVLVQGKRKQRIIPVITPHVNATLEFVRTVGKLYFQHRDSKSIVSRLILHFNDYLRTRYYLREVTYSQELYQKIALRSTIPIEDIRKMFSIIQQMDERIVNTDDDVKKLSKTIEEFKDKTT